MTTCVYLPHPHSRFAALLTSWLIGYFLLGISFVLRLRVPAPVFRREVRERGSMSVWWLSGAIVDQLGDIGPEATRCCSMRTAETRRSVQGIDM